MTNKQLFANQFIAIINRDGYTFMHEVRCEGHIVAVLPYRDLDDNRREYLARLEICPAHSPKLELCSITGGKEPDQSVAETAVQELWEEAGYQATIDELISLGKVRPSKASDTTAHLFAVDVTGKEQSTPEGDGSRFEVGSSVQWLDYKQAIQVEDALFVTAITRLLQEIN
ncbi:NUDIX domain-containing protein [Anaerolineales bacterium HSG25]|nr:NUDIX domain-containing protein [Anaerolineales bacterium HSG25]